MTFFHRPRSVKSHLLAWIIAPVVFFIVIDSVSLYRSARDAADTAYDRILVTTAYSVGDALHIDGREAKPAVSYATLGVYENEYSTRMIYRIDEADGAYLAGDRDLPDYAPQLSFIPAAPTLLEIYESRYGDAPVRVAAVFQPLSRAAGRSGVLIRIAEPLENRTRQARTILLSTLVRQALLVLLVAVLTVVVVNRALRPLAHLKHELDRRPDEDLSPLDDALAPKELRPVMQAFNQLIARLKRLLGMQQRFVSDASHQLRTPLAVLKAQAQSGLRGDAPLDVVIGEIAQTVDRATNLANQLLSLAKVEQLRGRGEQEVCDLAGIARDIAIEMSPLIAEKNLDFELDGDDVWVRGHPWMIGELIANLLNNAIRHTPIDGRLGIGLIDAGSTVILRVWDTGPGLPEGVETRVFEPFAGSHSSRGGGLGLTICAEIADSMRATLTLKNRRQTGLIAGLDARVEFRNARRHRAS